MPRRSQSRAARLASLELFGAAQLAYDRGDMAESQRMLEKALIVLAVVAKAEREAEGPMG